MTPEQRKIEEEQIRNNFSELQKKLEELKNEVQAETDELKKQEKNDEIKRLEKEASEMKALIDTLSSLQEQDLESLKTRLESFKNSIQSFRWEVADLQSEKTQTPTTCELLKNSETYSRLLNIISSNPDKFKKLQWETAEQKLEYIFEKIRSSIVLFMKNKLWNSENVEKIINNTIAPAFERSFMELLRDQWNQKNTSMLQWMDKISWDSFNKLINWVSDFARSATWSYSKFSQWINAVDYLSVHNWVLRNPNKSEVLSNPLKFKEYMNDSRFAAEWFSPYAAISDNIFKIDENQTFEFGMSLQEKQEILSKIWNIQVVNNPKTTALIAKMLDKPEKFLWVTAWLQKTANGLLDWISSLNSVTKIFWIDILWEISKAPEERGFLFKIINFVCKLIGITWWLEWIIKRWRLDRMNLTDDKNENISQIFNKYKELVWEKVNLSITDENSCKTALNDFAVTDPQNSSSTKWDFLRDSIAENMDVSLVSPTVIQAAIDGQILWNSLDYYLKKENTENWKEKTTVDGSKFTSDDKLKLAHSHLISMKTHLENYKDNDLSDFYANIHSTEDLALCITASLYADKNDVIEWVKAKVFLPENYGAVRSDWTVNNWNWNDWWRENLDSAEPSDKQTVSEQWIYDKAIEYWITDKRQIAYVLSTVKWEAPNPEWPWFKNQEEIGKWKWKNYWVVDKSTWYAYYGRWFIQLTWKENYQKYTQIIQSSWKDFKDNNGNTLKWSEIDLVNNPDIILQSNDLAAFILMDWMKNWWPDRIETKKLSHYINDNKQDYYNARIIINWMTSKPQEYANNALAYLDKLWDWSVDSPVESNELLIWPKLLAHNKDEIWWLGNSIMNWFQWGNWKSEFPNMDGVVWKNTRNHPRRFSSKNDVFSYKTTHPDVKCFMLYFWANNNNNQQTISDITQRSDRLRELGIQPVLCTNIWADASKTTHLQELNQKILALWKEKNIPVLDFAKSYKQWDITLSSDWLHPTSYATMTNIINWQLSQA